MNTAQRWRQRYESFSQAMERLSNTCVLEEYSELECAGLIQTSQFTFELAWKTLRDRLLYEGHQPNSPRETFKQAYANGLIEDLECWLNALDSRKVFTHTYNAAMAQEAIDLIKTSYYRLFISLRDYFEAEKNVP